MTDETEKIEGLNEETSLPDANSGNPTVSEENTLAPLEDEESANAREESPKIEEKKAKAEEEEDEEDGESMSFWDHLEVLRWSIFRCACVLTGVMVLTFIAMPYIFDNFVLAPTTSNFFVYRWLSEISHGVISFDPNFNVQIININVASQFMTHIHTSISFAAVIAFPYFIYEVWRFTFPDRIRAQFLHPQPDQPLLLYRKLHHAYPGDGPRVRDAPACMVAFRAGNPPQEFLARIQEARCGGTSGFCRHHHSQRRPIHPDAGLHPTLSPLRGFHQGGQRVTLSALSYFSKIRR